MFGGFAQQRAAVRAAEYNQAKAMREHMMFGRDIEKFQRNIQHVTNGENT